MTLLDRIRRRPRWEDPDPHVRAEAVRQIAATEQELLERIAREDADPSVRRMAVRRLGAPAVLGAVIASDSDAGVREKAAEVLLELASGDQEPTASAALAVLTEARHLLQIALGARFPAVRTAAIERLGEARLLARAARSSEDASVRTAAVERIGDATVLLEVAVKSEHKDAALRAVEKLDSNDALEEVARRAKSKAAARRARARREERGGPAVEPAPPDTTSPEAHAEALPSDGVTARPPTPEEEPTEAVAMIEPPAPDAPSDDVTEDATVVASPPETHATSALEPATPDETALPQEPAEAPIEAIAEAPAEAFAEATAEVPTAGPAIPTAAATEDEAARHKAETERRKKRLAQLEDVCGRLELLVKSPALGLRESDAGLKEAKAAQADLAGVPGRLVRRLKDARAALFARTQELRETEEWRRWGNATVQEELCRRIEALVPREDLEVVARELKALDTKWAEVKGAPRDEADALRQRYQTARAQIRPRLDAFFAKKAAEEGENLRRKQELVTRAEGLAESTDWLKASDELKALQARWKEIGAAPRKHAQPVWNRFRAACDRFFTRRKEDLRGRKEQWAANLVRKQALCEQAEALATSTEWEKAAAEVRKLQTDWKAVGPVRKDKSDDVWQRFRKACDAFFERYKNRDSVEREAKRAAREALCAELEALAATEGEAPAGVTETLQSVQARARQIPLSAAEESVLARRFEDARNRLIERWPESFRGTELDPGASRTRKEKLCARVEALAAQSPPIEERPLSGDDLARRLKEALASNTIGRAPEPAVRNVVEEVHAAQSAWSRLGPVPGDVGTALEERFRTACARILDARRPQPPRARPTTP